MLKNHVLLSYFLGLEQADAKDHYLLPSKSANNWTDFCKWTRQSFQCQSKRLDPVIYVYNNMAHASTKHTPHFLLYGKLGWLMRWEP